MTSKNPFTSATQQQDTMYCEGTCRNELSYSTVAKFRRFESQSEYDEWFKWFDKAHDESLICKGHREAR